MSIETISFFSNGSYVPFDAHGAPVPNEEGRAPLLVLQHQLNRGIVSPTTKVDVFGWEVTTVGDLIKDGHLKLVDSQKV